MLRKEHMENKKNGVLVIASSQGHYGFALATSDLSKEEICERAADEHNFNVEIKKNGDLLVKLKSENDEILVVDNPGVVVPQPVVVLDSGNGAKDLELLKKFIGLLAVPPFYQ